MDVTAAWRPDLGIKQEFNLTCVGSKPGAILKLSDTDPSNKMIYHKALILDEDQLKQRAEALAEFGYPNGTTQKAIAAIDSNVKGLCGPKAPGM